MSHDDLGLERWRAARIAANEAGFRDINEQLEEGLRRVPHLPRLLEFICECGDRSCGEVVRLTLHEYEDVRRDSRRFAVRPGHAIVGLERVVAGNERFEVVEKLGHAIEMTDAADRRSPGAQGRRGPVPAPQDPDPGADEPGAA